jgi:hypothetical protein
MSTAAKKYANWCNLVRSESLNVWKPLPPIGLVPSLILKKAFLVSLSLSPTMTWSLAHFEKVRSPSHLFAVSQLIRHDASSHADDLVRCERERHHCLRAVHPDARTSPSPGPHVAAPESRSHRSGARAARPRHLHPRPHARGAGGSEPIELCPALNGFTFKLVVYFCWEKKHSSHSAYCALFFH